MISAAIAIGLVLFITFPAALFNKTLEENYDDIRAAVERRAGWLRRLRSRTTGRTRWRHLLTFAVVLLVGAVLGGLLDPGFGLNASSVITVGAVVLAILFGMTVPALVNLAYRTARHQQHDITLHALPAGLVVAGFCVLVSRLTQFQPGYLYGVVVGLVFTEALARREQGHAVALRALATVTTAVIAWLIWLPVHSAAESQSPAALLVLAADFLGAVFAGGVVGSVLSLLPFRFLPGGALFAWSRVAWAATLSVAMFALVEIMLRPGSRHPTNVPLVTAIVLFAVAAAASVSFALYFAVRKRRTTAAAVS
ncbi:MAG TPA: FGLLP motif-containing membrane protein [Candidatus Dormibacteraeota bacterium]|nr:FGLLP motif-containing membrane protein [Candidatus Dormibacteraeota bacterium]